MKKILKTFRAKRHSFDLLPILLDLLIEINKIHDVFIFILSISTKIVMLKHDADDSHAATI